VQAGFLVIYACLDFVISPRWKKTREGAKVALVVLAIATAFLQHRVLITAHRQADTDRQQFHDTLGTLSSQVTDANEQLRATRKDLADSREQIVRLTRARQDDLQALNLEFAQHRAEDAARRSKFDISLPSVDAATPLPVLQQQLQQQLADYNRKQAEAQRISGEAAAAAAAVNAAKQSQEELRYTADIAHVFLFSLLRLQDLIIIEATTNGYTVSTNRVPVAYGRGQPPPPPQLPTEVRMFLPQVPLNMVHAKEEGSIQFPGKALWKIHLSNNDDVGGPFIIIEFTDSTGRNSGKFTFFTWRESGNKPGDKPVDKMHIDYEEPTPPLILSSAFTGDHELADYEPLLHRALTTIIRVQMAQSMSFTNAPVQPLKK